MFMLLTFPCPHCQRQLKVQEHLLGKSVRCPACKSVMTSAPILETPGARGEILVRPHRGATVLTLGLLGLCFAFCPLAGWILSGGALEMAREDIKAMSDGKMDPSGIDLTRGGRILGHVAAIISSLAAIVWGWMLFNYFTSR